jgi:hypothetical protein
MDDVNIYNIIIDDLEEDTEFIEKILAHIPSILYMTLKYYDEHLKDFKQEYEDEIPELIIEDQ